MADAKYKSLHPSATAPNGPQREKIYQMAAYLGRFVPPDGRAHLGRVGIPSRAGAGHLSTGRRFSPWSLDSSRKVIFTTLPHNASEAVAKLRELVTLMAPGDAREISGVATLRVEFMQTSASRRTIGQVSWAQTSSHPLSMTAATIFKVVLRLPSTLSPQLPSDR